MGNTMSRRILFFALAASASLIATQASADRECFENSCEQAEAVDQVAAAPVSPPVVDESAKAEASAAAPVKALPLVISTPVVLAPTPTPNVEVEASASKERVRLAPRYVKEETLPPKPRATPVLQAVRAQPSVQPPVASETPVALEPLPAVASREERAPQPERVERVRRVTVPVPVAVPVSADRGAIYAEDDVVRVYPNPRHDPAWKLCQLDGRERDQRRCGAYSYHPFGENGYRPYGVYAAQRPAAYVVAPNAKIISIDGND
jgi:hypothetical protein